MTRIIPSIDKARIEEIIADLKTLANTYGNPRKPMGFAQFVRIWLRQNKQSYTYEMYMIYNDIVAVHNRKGSVPSRTKIKKDMQYSSARNIMSKLRRINLIEKTHTEEAQSPDVLLDPHERQYYKLVKENVNDTLWTNIYKPETDRFLSTHPKMPKPTPIEELPTEKPKIQAEEQDKKVTLVS